MSYTITTRKSWSATQQDLATEFDRWGISDWETNYPKGARLVGDRQSESERTVTIRYVKNSKTVNLSMGSQSRAIDNLRVLYLAIESMRLNEKRGIGEVLESAYLQLSAPPQEKSPWEVLGVVPGTSTDVAEAVYRQMSLKYHPDKQNGDMTMMKLLNNAIEKIRKGDL